MPLPRHHELFNPTLRALNQLGGSGSISELAAAVIEGLGLSSDDIAQLHGNGPDTEVEYRLAWARTYLKIYGLIDNSQRGVWALTAKGRETTLVDPQLVNRFVRERSAERKREIVNVEPEAVIGTGTAEGWRDELLQTLKGLSPASFERLSQRVLRESGFTQVQVTGRTGDGGIDGAGILQLGGLVSFRVLFQCKRYDGTVGAGAIRDFRGAMVGRAERGLLITTGAFSQGARAEATRDGAPLIDLVDGDLLLDKLKELGLGVRVQTRTIEDVSVVPEFFGDI